MKVAELGETGIIEMLAGLIRESGKSQPGLILGIGDDAAVWQCHKSVQLATVDALREGVHFTRDMLAWYELGWKALAVNLSDIAAMGGAPQYALVSFSVPAATEVAEVEALYRGIIALAGKFDVSIIGGDTDCAPRIDICITVLGSLDGAEKMLTRAAARPGELVAVTGSLGSAAAGFEILAGRQKAAAADAAPLRAAFLKPNPRVIEGQRLLAAGVQVAIDISDGLATDLTRICRASHVGARIRSDSLPIAAEVRKVFGDRAPQLALGGGEDYELLFTAGADVINDLRSTLACPVTVIGEITSAEPGVATVLDGAGKTVPLERRGWEHFKTL